MATSAGLHDEPLRRRAPWVVVWRIVGILATMAGNVLAARCLGPANFGVYLLVSTVIALGSLLAMGGLNEAGLRFISESLGLGEATLARAYVRRVLLGTLLTSALAAFTVAIGLAFFQTLRGEFDHPLWIVTLATIGVVVLGWQQVAAEGLRGYGDLRLASLFSGGQSGGPLSNLLFLGALGVAALFLSGITISLALTLLVASIALTMPLALVGLWCMSHGNSSNADQSPQVALSREQSRQLLAAAGSLLLIQLLTFAAYQLDIWIGGGMLAPDELGLYGVAKRCQLLAQIPVQMAMMTVIATVPRLRVQNRMAELEQTVRRASTMAAIPSVVALAVLVLFPDIVLKVLFGNSYLGAAPILLPLVAGQLAHVMFGNPAYVLTMTGHHPLVLRLNVVAALIVVIVGAVGAAIAGPVGLAVGSASSLIAQNGLLWWFAKKRLGIWTHVALRSFVALPTGSAGQNTLAKPAEPAADEVAKVVEPQPVLHFHPKAPSLATSASQSSVASNSAAAPKSSMVKDLWWLHPGWPFAMVVAPTIIAAWLQDERAYRLYGTPKYVQFEHVVMGFAAIAVFTLGCALAKALGTVPRETTRDTKAMVRFWFYLTTILTIVGYAAWFAVGFKNGFTLGMFAELLAGSGGDYYDSIRRDLFPTIPGITTCTQFGVASVLLGGWLFVNGERGIIGPLMAVFAAAGVRCVLFSERTALIELLLPLMMVGLRAYVLGRPLRPVFRTALYGAPVIGFLGLILFFGFFEYYRSWNYYKAQFDSYAEFTMWRLSGYFTTAHNNGAMALLTNQPRPLPYFTLRPLWEFPGVSATPFSYFKLTGVDIPEAHQKMLSHFGTVELNNEGGLFQPALDYGWAGFLIYWCGYGFLATKVYRSFLAGTLAGVTLYPLVYMSILEVPLILFLFYTRTFPPLAALLVVAWLVHRASLTPQAASFAFEDGALRQLPTY